MVSQKMGSLAVLVLAAWISVVVGFPAVHNANASQAVASRAAQAARACQNIQLSVHFQGSQGAAGTIINIYRLHNLFGGGCTLDGYPGVQLLDKQFQSVHTVARRGVGLLRSIPKQLVRLAAHGNAYFTLLYNEVPVNGQPCETASYLMVFPPNDFLPVVAYAAPHGGQIYPCTGNIDVSPVTAQPKYP